MRSHRPCGDVRVHVAVHLRRRRRMPEQLLDRAQVGAALEQMRRERVTQAMRVGGAAACSCRAGARAPRGRARRSHRVRAPAGRLEGSGRGAGLLAERGTTRSLPPLPRTRTCSCSKSTSAKSSPTASALRSPAERARRARGCAGRRARRRHERRRSLRSPPALLGQALRPAWAERASGTRVGPSVKRRKERQPRAGGRSSPPRPRRVELGRGARRAPGRRRRRRRRRPSSQPPKSRRSPP